ncbi:alpha/beta fold hydrolase [Pedobacter lusitanus]|nr:alpha/beta hydrolase [Pedobacter lusitanus]
MLLTAVLIFFKWAFIVLLVMLLAGIIFEQYSRRKLERNIRKGKTFAAINGHQIHYVKKGKGNCTVIFESGLASDHMIWKEVQDEIAKDAVTLSYDRSGMFLSEAGDFVKTNESIANELTQLAELTHCPKPYIIVGHSIAGIYIRPFIASHLQDMAGIVLVDASHPMQLKRSSAKLKKANGTLPLGLIKIMMETGIFRLLFTFIPFSAEIPVNHRFHRIFKDFFYKSYRTVFLEAANDTLNFQDAGKYTSFGHIPLTVITGISPVRYAHIKDAALQQEYQELAEELHSDLLGLSTNNRLVKATKSGHIIQVQESGLIAEEIRRILLLNSHCSKL